MRIPAPQQRTFDPPHQLRDYSNWVLWGYETSDKGKPTKVLYVPELRPQLRRASHSDPDTWSSFTATEKIYNRRVQNFADVNGIGFVFSDEDPFTGIDLDSPKGEDGEVILETAVYYTQRNQYIIPWAKEILDELDTYTEISPSGHGLHAILEGTMPPGSRNRKGSIEVYDRTRYFTFTGQALERYPSEIHERQVQLESILSKHLESPPPDRTQPVHSTGENLDLEDEKILYKLKRAANAAKFERLFAGDKSDYEGDHSRSDAGLCTMIAFYTDDPAQVDRIFRASGLYRPKKWNEKHYANGETYGEHTCRVTIENRHGRYTGPVDPEPPRVTSEHESGATRVTASPASANPEEKPASLENVRIMAPAVEYPLEAMPKSTRRLIAEEAEALRDPKREKGPIDLVAVPVLAACSSAIGASRVLQPKRNFFQSAALFLCVVAPPGGLKSPASEPALRPVEELQDRYDAQYAVNETTYEDKLRQWEVDKKKAQADKKPAPPPPDPPLVKTAIVQDATMEALVFALKDNPRGLLNHHDELTGWIRGMDQYKSNGKGNERSSWLMIYDAKPNRVFRRSAGNKPVTI